jgi:hypothetical protein
MWMWIIVSVVLIVVAALAVGVAIAAMTGRLARNKYAGVSTQTTLSSEEAFAVANKVAAPTLVVAGIVLLVGAVVGPLLQGVLGGAAVVATIAVALLTAGCGGAMGVRAAAVVVERDEAAAGCGGCGGACGCGGSNAGLCSQ